METYQILGLIGSMLLVMAIVTPLFFYPRYAPAMMFGGMMGFGMMPGMAFFLVIPFALGVVGSLISDETRYAKRVSFLSALSIKKG